MVDTIDALKARAKELVKHELGARYDLGLVLGEMRHKWSMRWTGANTTADTFGHFCRAELGYSRHAVQQLIRVARSFTREEFDKLGVAKGRMILMAKQPVRDLMMREAMAGATLSQLALIRSGMTACSTNRCAKLELDFSSAAARDSVKAMIVSFAGTGELGGDALARLLDSLQRPRLRVA